MHDRFTALSALAAIAIAVLVLPRAIHTDDLEVIRAAIDLDYAALWTEPFRDLYYRPLTSTIVKVGIDTAGANPVLRAVQAALILVSLGLFIRIARDLAGPARLIGALCLCAAPFTFVAVAPFGVGIGDSLVGLALLICILESRRPLVLLAATVMALAAKESGLVVAVFSAAECLRRRRYAFAGLAAALAVGYLVAHAVMVEARPYILRTGYLTEMLSVAEQSQRFGDDPLGLRIYTAAANLLSVFLYIPYQGQLRITPAIAAYAVVTAGTAGITVHYMLREGRYRHLWPLLAVIPANAVLGFAYARPRIMFAAYVVIAVLFGSAVDDLWRRSRRLAIVALIAWIGVFAATVYRLSRMP